MLPISLWDAALHELTLILQPELAKADYAFISESSHVNEIKSQGVQDKEIRAVFMRLFAQILQG